MIKELPCLVWLGYIERLFILRQQQQEASCFQWFRFHLKKKKFHFVEWPWHLSSLLKTKSLNLFLESGMQKSVYVHNSPYIFAQ